MRTVRLDQAIFTSTSRAKSEGYRIIAASSGVGSAERRVLQRTAPSHGSLSPDAEDAVAYSYFAVSQGRVCIGRSIHVGMEQTGRGGRRVYTHFLLLGLEDFRAFDANPFRVVRQAAACGALDPDLDAAGTLDALEIEPEPDVGAPDRLMRTLDTTGLDQLGPLFGRWFNERPMVVLAKGDVAGMVESLLLSLPLPWRDRCSFGVGLKFSLTRRLALNFLHPDDAPASRRLGGTGLELINLAGGPSSPGPEAGRWADVIETLWRDRSAEALLELGVMVPAGITSQDLHRLADFALTAHALSRCDRAALLTDAPRFAQMRPRNEAETQIWDRFWRLAGERLLRFWSAAPDAGLHEELKAVANWARQDARIAGRLSSAVATALRQIASHDPPSAVETGLAVAHEGGDAWKESLRSCEGLLLTRLAEWVQSDEARWELALRLTEQWSQLRLSVDVAPRILESLRESAPVSCS